MNNASQKFSRDYIPRPLDTSSFTLNADILKLTELLAENSHDVWARQKVDQGWKWGPFRDDQKKEHPCLVPYKQLSESDKELDRSSALETIKMVMSLGLSQAETESRLKGDTTILGADLSEKSQKIISQFKKPKLTVAELRHLWQQRLPLIWLRNVEVYRRAVDAALKLGEAFLAFDIAEEGLLTFNGDLRLTQLQALALARTGATKRANEMLEHLRISGHHDEETLGILARTHKDFWLLSTDPLEKQSHLNLSFELYAEAYRSNGGYYSGINAAAMGLLSGRENQAREWAREVAKTCQKLEATLPDDSDEHCWIQATLAESALICGDLAKAERHYTQASQFGSQSWVVLHRTRAQARLLLEHIGENPTALDHCFKLPKIVVCAGHMFDRPQRRLARFPQALEEMARCEIKAKLAAMNAQIGFSSLACGADMLFAETILERGGEIHIVLPFSKEEFKTCSVEFISGANFGERFENILAKAASVTVLNELGSAEDPAGFEYANQTLAGMSLLKGQFFGIDVLPLAVWNKQKGDGRGGTESFVSFWQKRGTKVEIIDVTQFGEKSGFAPGDSELADSSAETTFFVKKNEEVSAQEIKAMLFADIKGYSKLSEQEIPSFVHHFLAQVAALMDATKNPPVVRNTWGDALHCVFDSVADAGIFALNLRDLVSATDWSAKGLATELNIRIGLHAGPVFPCFDPIVKRLTFLGAHVNRTARIEPVAEEGQIYASQAFAALSAANDVKEFVCDYVGQKALAKKFGSIPVFLVRRKM